MTPLQASIVTLVGSGGLLLSEALDLPNMPSRSSVYRWLRDDPEFAREYEAAREQAADLIDERIAQLARLVTPQNATAVRTQLAALQWRASKLHPQRYGGAASLAIEPNDAPTIDVAAARTRLLDKFDAVAERIEAYELERFFVARLVDTAVRKLESQRRLDPSDKDDRKAVLDAVRRAITPAFVPASGFVQNGHLSEMHKTAVSSEVSGLSKIGKSSKIGQTAVSSDDAVEATE